MAEEETITIILKAVDAATKPIQSVVQAVASISGVAAQATKAMGDIARVATYSAKSASSIGTAVKKTTFAVRGLVDINKVLDDGVKAIRDSYGESLAASKKPIDFSSARKAIEMARQITGATIDATVSMRHLESRSYRAGRALRAIGKATKPIRRIAGFVFNATRALKKMGKAARSSGGKISKMLETTANLGLAFNTVRGIVQAVTGALKSIADPLDESKKLIGDVKERLKAVAYHAARPIFDLWKTGMKKLLDVINDNDTAIQIFAARVGDKAVKAVYALRDAFMDVLVHIRKIVKESGAMEKIKVGGAAVKVGVEKAAAAGGGGAGGAVSAGLAVASLLGLIGPVTAIVIQGFMVLAKDVGAMTSIFGSLGSIVQSIMEVFGILLSPIVELGNVFGAFLVGFMPPLMEGIAIVGTALSGAASAVMDPINELIQALQPLAKSFGEILGKIFKVIGTILGPIVAAIGWVLGGIFKAITFVLKPVIWVVTKVFDALASALQIVVDVIGGVIDGIKGLLGGITEADRLLAKKIGTQVITKLAPNIFDLAATMAVKAAKPGLKAGITLRGKGMDLAVKRKRGGGRGGRISNFDFRNSRFDIRQEFAEGFDPDRIAVAFSEDLANMSERKVQSNLSPIFAVR